jgi:hypothetical protein
MCATAAIAVVAVATRTHAGHPWPADAAYAHDVVRVGGAGPTDCGAPTDDEISAAGNPEQLGTTANDSARADFDRKAVALSLTARERVAQRADAMGVVVPESLVKSLLASCRYGEWAQRRSVNDLAAFSNGARRWRTAEEMRFFVYVGLAEVAVEARGVGDCAIVAKVYAAIEPEIPLSSVRGRYHTMRWPA